MPKNLINNLIHPELSYQLVGILFDVYNTIGPGFQEKYYYRAIREAFKIKNIKFKEQLFIPLKYGDVSIGRYYIDFIVEDKIALEIKKGDKFTKTNIEQLYAYLKATNLKLGILVNFTSDGIKFKRIVNLN